MAGNSVSASYRFTGYGMWCITYIVAGALCIKVSLPVPSLKQDGYKSGCFVSRLVALMFALVHLGLAAAGLSHEDFGRCYNCSCKICTSGEKCVVSGYMDVAQSYQVTMVILACLEIIAVIFTICIFIGVFSKKTADSQVSGAIPSVPGATGSNGISDEPLEQKPVSPPAYDNISYNN